MAKLKEKAAGAATPRSFKNTYGTSTYRASVSATQFGIDRVRREAITLNAPAVAKALGGEARGNCVLAPGPCHSVRDRSMSVLIDWQAPDGFVVNSFAGDDPLQCRDYVRQMLGLPAWTRTRVPIIASTQKHGFARDNAASNNSERALRVFGEAVPLAGSLGEVYLVRRIGKEVAWSADLRFHKSCARNIGNSRERHPAILGLLRDIESNEPRAIQRIFLRPDGSDRLRDALGKATLGTAAGAVIKLSSDEDVTLGLGVTEGLETGLALMARGWSPIWATTGTSGMSAFPVLDGIESLTVFADHDENGAGERAAGKLIVRWREAGHEARGIKPRVVGQDWNDASRVVS
jgi:hypothetical protein